MRVLIVENDMIIAGLLKPLVEGAGHDVVGLAADRDSAMALLRASQVDLVLVDIHLADGWTGVDVVRRAAAEGVPAAFTTANRSLVPDDFAGACGVITKPYSDLAMTAALDFLTARLTGDVDRAPPASFEMSAAWAQRQRVGGAPPRREARA